MPEALIFLCERYHYPVYLFIYNQCRDPESARDLTQGFFELLIEKKIYRQATPERGLFRAFLLTSVKNYLKSEYRNATRQKRGGGLEHFSIELGDPEGKYHPELSSEMAGDALFDQQWAKEVFDRVWGLLRSEYEALGQMERYEELRPSILNPGASFPYEEVALRLSLSESATRSAAFRLKSRFREIFRATVAQLVNHPNEVDQEVDYLIRSLAVSPLR